MKTKHAAQIRFGILIGTVVSWYLKNTPYRRVDPTQITLYHACRSRRSKAARDRVIERQEKKR